VLSYYVSIPNMYNFSIFARCLTLLKCMLILIADGNGSFPIVMVGGVLEANKNWDIGKEVMNCIHKHYPGAYPIRPMVRIPLFPPLGKHWSRFHFLFFIIKQTLSLSWQFTV